MKNEFGPAAIRLKLVSLLGNHMLPVDSLNHTGAPGDYLDSCFDIEPNNHQSPDLAVDGIDIKYCGGKTPVTLFHFDPLQRPTKTECGAMKRIVAAHGYIGRDGRINFRDLVGADKVSPRGMRVFVTATDVIVRHISGVDQCSWLLDDIITRMAAKLSRVAFYTGTRRGRKVTYEKVTFHCGFMPSVVKDLLATGVLLIDFDARRQDSGDALRNHGVKFRIKSENLHLLFKYSASI